MEAKNLLLTSSVNKQKSTNSKRIKLLEKITTT